MIDDPRHAARERMILDAAHGALHSQGFADMHLDGLARQLGMGKATLYRHFASKEDLAAAVIADRMLQVSRGMEDLPASLSPLQRVESMLLTSLRNRLSTSPGAVGIPHHVIAQNPRLHVALVEVHERTGALLREAQEAGEVRGDLSIPFLLAWVSTLFGTGIDMVAQVSGLSPDEASRRVVDVFLHGIRTR